MQASLPEVYSPTDWETFNPFNMDMRRGHYTVDAKSLFGILNLGLERKIELKVYDENCDALFEDIAQYVAA